MSSNVWLTQLIIFEECEIDYSRHHCYFDRSHQYHNHEECEHVKEECGEPASQNPASFAPNLLLEFASQQFAELKKAMLEADVLFLAGNVKLLVSEMVTKQAQSWFMGGASGVLIA